jgi:hypothetical protein
MSDSRLVDGSARVRLHGNLHRPNELDTCQQINAYLYHPTKCLSESKHKIQPMRHII